MEDHRPRQEHARAHFRPQRGARASRGCDSRGHSARADGGGCRTRSPARGRVLDRRNLSRRCRARAFLLEPKTSPLSTHSFVRSLAGGNDRERLYYGERKTSPRSDRRAFGRANRNALLGIRRMNAYQGETTSWSARDRILEVTLHREPGNEIGSRTLEEWERLVDAIGEAIERDEIGAILWWSANPSGFGAGADLRELYERMQ